MNAHLKGFYRRVAANEGSRPSGRWAHEHALRLTCGHVAFRRGGPRAQWGGAFCSEYAMAGSKVAVAAWGLQ